MKTHCYTPSAPLSFFVEVIWFSEAENFDYASLTLPMLRHELIINFSDCFNIYDHKTLLVSRQQAWISGLQTRPVRTATCGRHVTMGILFRPWGLYAITGIDAVELHNQYIPLHDVFGKEAIRLTEQIFHQAIPAGMFRIMECFLLKALNSRTIPAYVLQSLEIMYQTPPADGLINKIAETVAVSSKTCIQAFKKYIGLTPAKFHHLLLLNKLLCQLAQHPSQKLTEVGYELHFFDQAHFIHFFRKYTDLTPSAYIQQFKAGKIDPAIPHAIEISLG